MKKTLSFITLFGLLATSALHAQPAYSNIVGMIKTTVQADAFELISLPLLNANDETVLRDAFADVPDGTVVFLWNGLTYTDYTYFGGVWYDAGFTPEPAQGYPVPSGASVWVKSPSATDIVHSGNAPTTASYDVSFGPGFNLVSNPYPLQIAVNDIDTTDLEDGDVIFLWNGTNYVDYTFFGGVWYDAGFQPADATDVITAGVGFWLSSTGTGNLTFNKTY